MKFYDKVKVKVIAWDGWNGCVSWRREKYIAYGWPDWWDGWRGWSIYFVWDEGESSLIDLYYKKQIKAKRWEHGKWSQQYWESAEDVFVKVPIWTIIKDAKTGQVIWVIRKHGEKVLVAKWWRWWWWNMHFATPVRQFPNFAMFWEPGEQRDIIAELQLIWDVTLIWFPSVWKSSIINTLSNAKAKVADYPFTTLVPNLGVVKHKWKNFVIVDVPGLIEGAWEGRGLWFEFLRHILKSKIWTFVLDISRYEKGFEELKALKNEIEKYIKQAIPSALKNVFPDISPENIKISYEILNNGKNFIVLKVFYKDKLLFEKVLLFLINKVDLVQDEEILQEYKKELKRKIREIFGLDTDAIYFVHAQNKNVFNDFLDDVIKILQLDLNSDTVLDEFMQPKIENVSYNEKKENYVKNITDKELNKLIQEGYLDEDEAEWIQVWEVYNPKLAYYTWIIPWWNKEAEMFFYEVMQWEWISSWLEQNWVFPWDIVKVVSIYPWKEDRYLRWGLDSGE